MADFRSFLHSRRVPAVPMQPVIDPAGWTPESLGSVDDFSYAISDSDADELVAPLPRSAASALPSKR